MIKKGRVFIITSASIWASIILLVSYNLDGNECYGKI